MIELRNRYYKKNDFFYKKKTLRREFNVMFDKIEIKNKNYAINEIFDIFDNEKK